MLNLTANYEVGESDDRHDPSACRRILRDARENGLHRKMFDFIMSNSLLTILVQVRLGGLSDISVNCLIRDLLL